MVQRSAVDGCSRFEVIVGIVPLDASLASFGDINRGKWPGAFQPKTSTIFSYGMNNYWHTNYRAGQGGEFKFRYAMTSAAQLDGGALRARLGLDEMRPPRWTMSLGKTRPEIHLGPSPPRARDSSTHPVQISGF